jgi:UDPglucose--hexose-1-phosphate uridylyltransferase
MQELRWNPIMKEWVIVASHRKDRPMDESGQVKCPFCQGASEVAGDWKVLSLTNRFSSLSLDPCEPSSKTHWLYEVAPAYGSCEVILETKEHEGDLGDLPVERIKKVIDLFAQRFTDLSSRKGIKYVFEFRNKGKEIGVSLHHPHSQLYALPFIPPVLEKELASSREYRKKEGECLFCRILKEEKADGRRVICENAEAICFLPFAAKWPYETHVYPKRHLQCLPEMSEKERYSFAAILKEIITTYNNLFDFSLPYIMAVHQRPTDSQNYDHYHLHIEFYPPHRSRDKLKFTGGVERGTGTFIMDYEPEEKASELRNVHRRLFKPQK